MAAAAAAAESESTTQINMTLLKKKSARWFNLSTAFWALAVLDARRSVDCASLSNFLDVMEWRARGKITENEFTAMFGEWVGGEAANKGAAASGRRKGAIGVFAVRQLLLDRKCEERDLDLLIGMLIHEGNRSLLNAPISYLQATGKARGGACAKQQANKGPASGLLEVVSSRWLTLSEELFFALYGPGY